MTTITDVLYSDGSRLTNTPWREEAGIKHWAKLLKAPRGRNVRISQKGGILRWREALEKQTPELEKTQSFRTDRTRMLKKSLDQSAQLRAWITIRPQPADCAQHHIHGLRQACRAGSPRLPDGRRGDIQRRILHNFSSHPHSGLLLPFQCRTM